MTFIIEDFIKCISMSTDSAFQYLKENPTNQLNLSNIEFFGGTLERLADVLKVNNCITEINFSECNLRDKGLETIAQALQENKRITKLNLSKNDLTAKSGKVIQQMLINESEITELDLSDNSLGDDGIKAISIGLRSNKVLESLNIASNNFKKGALFIANAIKFRTKNLNLDLSNNQMGDNEAKFIAAALNSNKDNSPLSIKFEGNSGITPIGEKCLYSTMNKIGEKIDNRNTDNYLEDSDVTTWRNRITQDKTSQGNNRGRQ